MALTYTAKGSALAKSSGTTLTIPNITMVGGDMLVVTVAYIIADNSAPSNVEYGPRELEDEMIEGKSFSLAGFRMRQYAGMITNTKTKDLEITFPNSTTTRIVMACSLHQGTKVNITNDNENLATNLSTSGGALAADHITSLNLAYHLTNGPAGDAIGTSSTGFTLGQRTGTTGDADTSNITLQETYKIVTAPTVLATASISGDSYQIKTIGTTDWTLIGATSNTVGEQFEATGVGTGTGDAYHLDPLRSRLIGLATRDHIGMMAWYRPRRTYTVKSMLQYNRNVNQNPDWVMIEVEDDNGRGFWMRVDPELFDDWSDTVIDEYIAKFCSVWETNLYDDNLVYEADSTRNTRMATFVDKMIIL